MKSRAKRKEEKEKAQNIVNQILEKNITKPDLVQRIRDNTPPSSRSSEFVAVSPKSQKNSIKLPKSKKIVSEELIDGFNVSFGKKKAA